jgi:hypothetical protein
MPSVPAFQLQRSISALVWPFTPTNTPPPIRGSPQGAPDGRGPHPAAADAAAPSGTAVDDPVCEPPQIKAGHYVRGVVASGHWVRWHEGYEYPSSPLSRRLAAVQRRLGEALDQASDGPIRMISMCAGQGRDVIPVLANHPRGRDVRARLVELDPELVAHARTSVTDAGLEDIEIVAGDASATSAYEGAVPADVILVCGVFGNISDVDVRATVFELPHLSAPGAHVIWTRHRRSPDLTPVVRRWFADAGFEEEAFDTEDGSAFGVGATRLVGPPLDYRPDRRMFTFRSDEVDARA